MQHRDRLRKYQDLTRADQNSETIEKAHLAERERVESREHRGEMRSLVEVVLEFGNGVQGPYPDSPANVPVFVPLLSGTLVIISLMTGNQTRKNKHSP